MKIKIQGWPLYVLVLALQQLMTFVFFFQQTATSTFQCTVLLAGLFRGKPLVIRFVWCYIQPLFALCRKKTFEKSSQFGSPNTKSSWEKLLSQLSWETSLLSLCFDKKLADVSLFCFVLTRKIWAGACEKRRAYVSKTITMTIFSFNRLVFKY